MGSVKCLSVLLLVISWRFAASSFDACLQRDSITCLQMQIYGLAKDFLDRGRLQVGGLTVRQSRSGKAAEALEARIISATGVAERQLALEDYFAAEAKHLWNEGSLSWNPVQTARSLIDSIPRGVKSEIGHFYSEGRGKQKKQMQMLLPLLIGLKLKLAALGALGYMGIAVIAKKAILAGVISLLVSGFIAVKNLIEAHRMPEEMTAYHAAWEPVPVWSPGMHDQELAASQSMPQKS